ncbi:MAG: diadenylate cyclase [Desertimonas sp.]
MERRSATPRQLDRLREELAEIGLRWDGSEAWHEFALTSLEYARRPRTFEHRTPSFGAIIGPTTDHAGWGQATGLRIERRHADGFWSSSAYLYADGLSCWIVLDPAGGHHVAIFDRPAGSERDLVVIAAATGATLVQRHPDGIVRIVGATGVHRWDGMDWQHQAPLSSWIDAIVAVSCDRHDDRDVLEGLVEFALHDLGARHIGATLIYRADDRWAHGRQSLLPPPPRLDIRHPPDLGPLRHSLAQIDGATVFDAGGIVREIGVRLVPSTDAESDVPALRGMRHTSAVRYSADDRQATIITVSESGGVTVLRQGRIVGVAPGSDTDGD